MCVRAAFRTVILISLNSVYLKQQTNVKFQSTALLFLYTVLVPVSTIQTILEALCTNWYLAE